VATTQTSRKSVRSRKQPAAAAPPASRAFPGHALIARRAYELFLERGGEHGHDWEDWLAAERELRPSGIGVMVEDLAHQ
jgi:Protein of unknown function (DUF2934)